RSFAAITEKRRIVRWHGEEKSRPMPLDGGKNISRVRFAGQENAGRSYREREIQAVSETIGKEQLGDAETAILLGHAENALCVSLGGDNHVVLQVNTGLRGSGRARRKQQERRIIFTGGFGIEFG